MNILKSGFTALIGRPNVGKSSLLNKILRQKIVIATDKAQTTRRRIQGIYTDNRGQIVFVDTPGIHKPKDKLGEYLFKESKEVAIEADLVLFIVDVSSKIGLGDIWIANNIIKSRKNTILVLNKLDLVNDIEKLNQNILNYRDLIGENVPFIKISSKTGENVDDLVSVIFNKLPQGPLIYPENQVTNESLRDISKEVIREKILLNTKEEIPHSVAVKIDKYIEENNIDKIYATIYVDQKSQKGILIGKNGSMIKEIGSTARIELEDITQKKVFLDLQVKLYKDWKKDTKFIENNLYS